MTQLISKTGFSYKITSIFPLPHVPNVQRFHRFLTNNNLGNDNWRDKLLFRYFILFYEFESIWWVPYLVCAV